VLGFPSIMALFYVPTRFGRTSFVGGGGRAPCGRIRVERRVQIRAGKPGGGGGQSRGGL
jgi:hypothetical protein